MGGVIVGYFVTLPKPEPPKIDRAVAIENVPSITPVKENAAYYMDYLPNLPPEPGLISAIEAMDIAVSYYERETQCDWTDKHLGQAVTLYNLADRPLQHIFPVYRGAEHVDTVSVDTKTGGAHHGFNPETTAWFDCPHLIYTPAIECQSP